jgi:quercetin dioxygenase-like cupin family protein
MYQLIATPASLPTLPLPIPGGTPAGAFTLQMLNATPAYGPTVYILTLAPGSRIPAHLHRKATETFLVLEGEFIDAGKTYPSGTYFAVTPGTVHGPHQTQRGCRLLVFQTAEVDATDFFPAE